MPAPPPAPVRLACALLLAGLCAGAALAQTTVYRCRDAEGRTLFTERPCPGGETVDADGGRADPQAIERLEREVEAFRQREAARRAQNARDDELAQLEAERRRLERELAAARAREAERAAAATSGFWGGWGWLPPAAPAPPRPPPPPRPPRPPPVIVPVPPR